jgi:hypothetical protein
MVRDTNLAEFSFNFDEPEVFTTKGKKKFTNVDVLSYVGGMLGLFSGFSLLSFIEIVYVFVVQPLFNAKCLRSNKVHGVNVVTEKRPRKCDFILNYMENSSIHSFFYIVHERKFASK